MKLALVVLLMMMMFGSNDHSPTMMLTQVQPSTAPAATQTAPSSQPEAAVREITPFPGVLVHLEPSGASFIEVRGRTCLDEGWLEQVMCSPQSREHESLVVTSVKPSQIHAALLMSGFAPGSPGKWTYENDRYGTIPPTGDKLDIFLRYADATGKIVEHSVRTWIRDGAARQAHDPKATDRNFPNLPWVFAGSRIAANPASIEPPGGEHYVADMSGSIIGLVTFGDEVIGFSRVFADQADVQSPEWEVNTQHMPPLETEVTVILRKYVEAAE